MNCARVIQDEIAEKYLSGQLEASLEDEFELHLLECPHCQQLAEVLDGVRAELGNGTRVIAIKPMRRWLSAWLWAPVAAAAVVLIAVFLTQQMATRPAPQRAASPTPTVAPPAPAPSAPSPQPLAAETTVPANKPARQPGAVLTAKAPDKPGLLVKPVAPPEIAQQPPPAFVPPVEPARTETQAPAAAVARQHKKSAAPLLSDQSAKELYLLGVVQPPPYTFLGLSKQAKNPSGKTGLGAAPLNSSAQSLLVPARAAFQNAMTAYVEKRYADAAYFLEQSDKLLPGEADVNFYLGVCRLMEAHAAASVQPFKTVIAKGSSTYLQPAHFYLAKAYIQVGNLADAEAELQAAAALPGRLTAETNSMLPRLQRIRAEQQGTAK